jgi:hypothetical protein
LPSLPAHGVLRQGTGPVAEAVEAGVRLLDAAGEDAEAVVDGGAVLAGAGDALVVGAGVAVVEDRPDLRKVRVALDLAAPALHPGEGGAGVDSHEVEDGRGAQADDHEELALVDHIVRDHRARLRLQVCSCLMD